VLSPSAKSIFGLQSKTLRLVCVVIVVLLSITITVSQRIDGRTVVFPITIDWNKQKNVTRYRLQIAADEKFQDVFFDGRVNGNRYVVTNLLPGAYYWRVAPADAGLGEFSRAARFFLSGGVVTTVQPVNRFGGSGKYRRY
jgi:hypothetical protein